MKELGYRNNQEEKVQYLLTNEELRAIDREYLSWGDTVHYQENPIMVSGCQGMLMFDEDGHILIAA